MSWSTPRLSKPVFAMLASLALAGCQNGFEPHIANAPFPTAPNPMLFATVPGLELTLAPPIQVTSTPETMIGAAPTSLRGGAPDVMSYERVPCGDLGGPLCYELCYEGVCINVRAGDPRVDVFIHAVDALGELNQAKEGDEKSNRPRTMNLFAKCGVSLVVAAASGYGLVAAWAAVTATDPEPVTKIISIGGGLFAAGLYCGAQIWLEDLAASAYNTRLAAVDGQLAIGREMFGDLLFNPPE